MLIDFDDIPWDHTLTLLGTLTFAAASIYGLYFILLGIQRSHASKVEESNKWVTDAAGLIKGGLAKANSFRFMGDKGSMMVLSPKYASEISSIKALSHDRLVEHDLYAGLRGFEPFNYAGTHLFQDTVRKKLTQTLGSVTKPVAEEASLALEHNWTNNPEWHSFRLAPTLLKQIAQQSSRVFLGEKICRDPEWLRITTEYTTNSFKACEELPAWPTILHPIAVRILDSAKKVQQDLQRARDIIRPALKEREEIKEAARREGKPLPVYNDALEWMEQTSRGMPYDPAAVQLLLSTFSLHTTADMITQAVFDLLGKDDLIHELREEIISVLSQEGWKKTALNKLNLMDSFLKESQRLKPLNYTTLRRIAEQSVELKDGTKIAKGTSLVVPCELHWDEKLYESPETFDPYRFLKHRQKPGTEHRAQLIMPTAEHMGFGLGMHACPGRFSATSNIKIALCHILLKYDIKLPEGSIPKKRRHGGLIQADPEAEIMVRRRQEEINFEDIFNMA